MSYKSNVLSALGRMSYSTHLLVYPGILGVYLYVVKPYMKKRADDQEKSEWESMPKNRKVDPDLFNPFTPIPYHNNPELKYGFAHINMHNYLNDNQINTKDYVWKAFHNSYDHNNEAAYTYNWTSLHSPRDNNSAHSAHGHDAHH